MRDAVKTKDMASVVRLYYLENGLKKKEAREKARDVPRRSTSLASGFLFEGVGGKPTVTPRRRPDCAGGGRRGAAARGRLSAAFVTGRAALALPRGG